MWKPSCRCVIFKNFWFWWCHWPPAADQTLLGRLFQDCCIERLLQDCWNFFTCVMPICKIVPRLFICTIKMKFLRDCCKIVFNFSHMLCPICEIVERLLQDCCRIVSTLYRFYFRIVARLLVHSLSRDIFKIHSNFHMCCACIARLLQDCFQIIAGMSQDCWNTLKYNVYVISY